MIQLTKTPSLSNLALFGTYFTIQILKSKNLVCLSFPLAKMFFLSERGKINFHKFQTYGLCQIHLVLLQASLLAANIIPFFCNLAKIRSIRLMSHM